MFSLFNILYSVVYSHNICIMVGLLNYIYAVIIVHLFNLWACIWKHDIEKFQKGNLKKS